MNILEVIQTEGYPLKAERLKEIETAYAIFNSLGSLAGNFTIISGCETVGTTVKKGFVYINGELLEFRQAPLTPGSTVIIIEEQTPREFKSTAIKNVYTIRYATFGTATTSWPWTDFTRPIEIKTIPLDLVSRLNAIETKLATIAEGAEVNVQADMSVTNTALDAYVKNKPVNDIIFKGSYDIGDVPGGNGTTVNVLFQTGTFPFVLLITLPTNQYDVLGSLRSNGSNSTNTDTTVIWSTRSHTTTGFVADFRETGNGIQDLIFDFVIVRK